MAGLKIRVVVLCGGAVVYWETFYFDQFFLMGTQLILIVSNLFHCMHFIFRSISLVQLHFLSAVFDFTKAIDN